MAEQLKIKATKRTVIGKQVRALRRQGMLPGIVYGKHITPIPIMLNDKEWNRPLSQLSSSHIVTLDIDGEEYPVLLRDKQRNFILGNLTHVDFLAVSMTEKLRTEVRIELVGSSPAVTDFGGVLVTGVTEVEVECLPKDLPDVIPVDISSLVKIGQSIHVEDLSVPSGVTILTPPHEMVVQITVPAGEEVATEEVGAAEPEVVEKGKKEKEKEE